MSDSAAVVLVTAVVTISGLGTLAAVRLARSPRELVARSPAAPLAGMAWAGIGGATVTTVGLRLGLAGLLLLTVIACGIGAVRLRRSEPTTVTASPRCRDVVELLLTIGGLLAIAVVTVAAFALFRLKPLVEYDGWAIWGMKARALAVLGGADSDLFASPAYARLHLEYPLLLPSLDALPLQLADRFSSNTVVLNCFVIGLAGLLALWGLLRDRVRPALLVPCLAAITTMPAFFGQLATGYADVPLALFIAAGVVCTARWLLDEERPWLGLATVFLAASTLTKNEGVLFAVAVYVALVALASTKRREALVSAAVVALLYAPWRVYVFAHDLGARDYDLTRTLDVPWVIPRLGRARAAGNGLLEQAFDRHQFGLVLVLALLAVAAAVAVGPRRLGLFAAAFSLLAFVGLTWIYVLTPYPVEVFLPTNGNRVVMSLVVALGALTPLLLEEAVARLARKPAEGVVGTPR